MSKAITDEEREKILELLREGFSHGEVARRTGRSQSAVSALAKEYSIEPVYRMPKAQLAVREYNKVERLNLLNLMFATRQATCSIRAILQRGISKTW
jgi:IS30 family transposase